jgi:hypothetical protein
MRPDQSEDIFPASREQIGSVRRPGFPDLSRMLRAAPLYAWLGFAVFPTYSPGPNGRCRCGNPHCKSPGKHPWTPHGCLNASKDPAAIRAMFEPRPQANVAITTGAESGIWVLDVDPRHTGDVSLEILEHKYGKLPDTPTVRTGGGGLQFYWRWPAGIDIRSSSSEIGAGLDVKGTGGYVVAPPSLHISGCRYHWEWSARIDEIPIADAPGWLIDLALNPLAVPGWLLEFVPNPTAYRQGRNGQHLPAGQVSFERIVAGIPDGKRDWELFRLADWMRRQGYSRPFVEQVVLDAARRCRPACPFPERVAKLKVKSAWRYA